MANLINESDWNSEEIARGYCQRSCTLSYSEPAAYINFGDVYRPKLRLTRGGIYNSKNTSGQKAVDFETPDFSSPFCSADDSRVVLEDLMKRYVDQAISSPYLVASCHGLQRRQQMGLPEFPLCTTKRLLSTHTHLPGIHSTYAYLSSGPSFTAMHKEDFGLQSANLLHRGSPKIWVVIAPRHSTLLEANLTKGRFACSQAVRHLNVMPMPETLEEWGVKFEVIQQNPGDLIMTDYGVYYYVWNTGPSLAEAVNVCGPKWFPPPAYVSCRRSADCPAEINVTKEDMQIDQPRTLEIREPIAETPKLSSKEFKFQGPPAPALVNTPAPALANTPAPALANTSAPAPALAPALANTPAPPHLQEQNEQEQDEPEQDQEQELTEETARAYEKPVKKRQKLSEDFVSLSSSESEPVSHLLGAETALAPLSPMNHAKRKAENAVEVIDLTEVEEKPDRHWISSDWWDVSQTISGKLLPNIGLFFWPSGSPGDSQTATALETLWDQDWLNDRIISEVLILLTSDVDHVCFVDPIHLKARFENGNIEVLPSLDRCTLLLAPFCIGGHWFLVSADFHQKRLICHNARARPKEMEYIRNVITADLDDDVAWESWEFVQCDETIPMDGNNCGVFLLAQAQHTIDKSYNPAQGFVELRLHFWQMLIGPTRRRVETLNLDDFRTIPRRNLKKRRLFFHEVERSKGKVDIIDMVNAVGSPAVFADLALVLQSIATKPSMDMSMIEVAMSSYTTSMADSLASKIRKIYACMILQERYEERVRTHRFRLKTQKKFRKSRRRQGCEDAGFDNTTGKDARHHALNDIVSEWQGVSVAESQAHWNYKKQRKAVEEAKKIGQQYLELQKRWEDRPLWSMIPHRPILMERDSVVVDAESYRSLSREEAAVFVKELKSRRPLFWENVHRLSNQILRCLDLGRDAPRVLIHEMGPDDFRSESTDSDTILHCLDEEQDGEQGEAEYEAEDEAEDEEEDEAEDEEEDEAEDEEEDEAEDEEEDSPV